jgi:putative Holliday junction resolvase
VLLWQNKNFYPQSLIRFAFYFALFGYSSAFESMKSRLAIDYGPRLVGIAASDPFGLVKPYCTLPNNGDLVDLSTQILDIARLKGASDIIIGIPLDSNGKLSYNVRNFNGQLCLAFSQVISSMAGALLPKAQVLIFDERYTTREAKFRMKTERIKGTELRHCIASHHISSMNSKRTE